MTIQFKPIIFSGVCLCGHSWEDHHNLMVANPDAAAIIGSYYPQECEFFGCNEDGGIDDNGQDHCWEYVDKDNPEQEIKDEWKGTTR